MRRLIAALSSLLLVAVIANAVAVTSPGLLGAVGEWFSDSGDRLAGGVRGTPVPPGGSDYPTYNGGTVDAGFAFLYMLRTPAGDKPVVWPDCLPLILRVFNASPDQFQAVRLTAEELTRASGLTVSVEEGQPGIAPEPSDAPERGVVRVVFRDDADYLCPDFSIGCARPPADKRSGSWTISSGHIEVRNSLQGADPADVVLHEVGHSAGLAHVTRRSETMYPQAPSTPMEAYGPGDTAGLQVVGSSPCGGVSTD